MSEKGILLPFYLVIDVSVSMQGAKIDQANLILPEVADTLAKHPILNDKVRFGLIDFSDDARLVLPLCDMSNETTLPKLSTRGGTSYGAAFQLLRGQIEQDVKLLTDDGFKVHRPAVFFLSDGEPGDSWQAAFATLTHYDKATGAGFKQYPVIVPLGVESADHQTMKQLVYPTHKSKLYMMQKGGDGAAAIKSMAEILISSILASGQSAATGGSGFVLPNQNQVPAGVVVDDDWLN